MKQSDKPGKPKSEAQLMREKIAKRAALEFQDGMYCNLGIGIPTLASNYIPQGIHIDLQSENGLLGMVRKKNFKKVLNLFFSIFI